MAYALVSNATIQSIGRLPRSARRLDTSEWVMGLATAPAALVEACGYFEVVQVDRPDDTPTDTYDRSVDLVAGVPTVVWTQRAKTQAELDADAAEAEAATMRDFRDDISVFLDELGVIETAMKTMSATPPTTNATRTRAIADIAQAVADISKGLRRPLRAERRLIRDVL